MKALRHLKKLQRLFRITWSDAPYSYFYKVLVNREGWFTFILAYLLLLLLLLAAAADDDVNIDGDDDDKDDDKDDDMMMMKVPTMAMRVAAPTLPDSYEFLLSAKLLPKLEKTHK